MKSNTTRTWRVAALVGLAAVAGGCAHRDAIPPLASNSLPNPAPAPSPPVATTTTTGAQTNGSGRVAVSAELVEACNLHFGDVDQAPKFEFDKSELGDQDRSVLQQIASCVTSGPLKGRALSLVGRADPRGEVEYNMALGGHRASSVSTYLVQLGVDASKLNETSRGNLDATGTDEASWSRDRRVDISLR